MCHSLAVSLIACVCLSLCLSVSVCLCRSDSVCGCMCLCVFMCVFVFLPPQIQHSLQVFSCVTWLCLLSLHPPPTPTYSWQANLTLCSHICSASLGGKRFLSSCTVATSVQSLPTETVDWYIPRQEQSMPNLPPQPIQDSPVGDTWRSVYWEFYVSSGQL